MSDGRIYIHVGADKPAAAAPAKAAPSTESSQAAMSKSGGETMLGHWAKSKMISEAGTLIRGAVDFGMSNYGDLTGDYITQGHLNDSMQIAHTLSNIGSSAVSGFIIGGPLGAAFGASLSLLNSTVGSLRSGYMNQVRNEKTNYDIRMLRDRSGLNSLKDGSRGTED